MNTCKTCVSRVKMSSGIRTAMYCVILSSRRSKNGHLRVKTNQPACGRYSYTAEGPQTIVPNQLTLFND